ncbi:MAG: hypothetical protein LBP82_02515 [Candidatus Methanoplasma sp.]|nr:hypothetical protein [Candidatus Methanoplasma sp.]
MVSQRKKTNMKYGAIIGAVVGVAIFVLTYTINNNPIYLIFIPIAAGMGWAMQYVKDEGPED